MWLIQYNQSINTRKFCPLILENFVQQLRSSCLFYIKGWFSAQKQPCVYSGFIHFYMQNTASNPTRFCCRRVTFKKSIPPGKASCIAETVFKRDIFQALGKLIYNHITQKYYTYLTKTIVTYLLFCITWQILFQIIAFQTRI